MKTKIVSLFFAITSIMLFSGCVSTQTIRVGDKVFEGVVPYKNLLLLASRDNINVTNICPQGYFVDFKKGSEILFEGIITGQTITVHPQTAFRDEAVAFSSTVYTKGSNGEKRIVSFSNQIINIGGAPITVTWNVSKDYASVNWQRPQWGYY